MVLFLLFLYLLHFRIIISYITILLIVNPNSIPVDNGRIIKPIPVRYNVIELDVVAITTYVSNDFNFVVDFLCFLE